MTSKTKGAFSVQVQSSGQWVPLFKGLYFELKDGAEFAIGLTNNGTTKADACVTLDGEIVGRFRMEPATTFPPIERPQGIFKKFTFHTAKGVPAADGNDDDAPLPVNGKLVVTFTPERAGVRSANVEASESSAPSLATGLNGTKSGYEPDLNSSNYGSGATILGAPSTQQFGNLLALITDFDPAEVVTISAWMVIRKS
jgi:hypothetical protein